MGLCCCQEKPQGSKGNSWQAGLEFEKHIKMSAVAGTMNHAALRKSRKDPIGAVGMQDWFSRAFCLVVIGNHGLCCCQEKPQGSKGNSWQAGLEFEKHIKMSAVAGTMNHAALRKSRKDPIGAVGRQDWFSRAFCLVVIGNHGLCCCQEKPQGSKGNSWQAGLEFEKHIKMSAVAGTMNHAALRKSRKDPIGAVGRQDWFSRAFCLVVIGNHG